MHAAPVRREIIGAAVGELVAHSAERAPSVDELRGDDRPVAHERAVLPHLLVDDAEFIACSYVEDEVDVPAEDVRERQRRLIGNASRSCGFEQ